MLGKITTCSVFYTLMTPISSLIHVVLEYMYIVYVRLVFGHHLPLSISDNELGSSETTVFNICGQNDKNHVSCGRNQKR